MASISKCFIIVTPKPYSKPSSFFSLKPSRQLHYSLRSDKDVFHFQLLKLSQHRSISHIRRSFKSEIRASFTDPSVEATPMVRLGRIIESDKLPADVRKRVMDAVDKCGRRVTVGDVAGKVGIMLAEAQRALQAIAADTNGFLEVSDEGDILYVFPKDYRSKLASKSLRIRMEPYLEKAKSGGEYLIRVIFGTTLFASILIIFTAIIVILSSSSDSDEKERRSSSRSRALDSLISRLSDLFWHWDPRDYSRQQVRVEDDRVDLLIAEYVFSFVFGDGDPNERIEEERWKMIGQYIGLNGGVVTAEELAPFLDIVTAEKLDDDSYILPVLFRFDGQPQVDKEGNILYQFPSFQRTADSEGNRRKEYLGKEFKERVGRPDKFFKEKKWKFSKLDKQGRAIICGLGGLNLFGVLFLGAMLKTTKFEPRTFISFVSEIFPLLQCYAVSFLAIPLARLFLIQRKNAEIEKRNQARELCARALELPDISLRKKILSARDMSQRTVINEDRIVYTTSRDVSEQDYDKQEWDRQFEDVKDLIQRSEFES